MPSFETRFPDWLSLGEAIDRVLAAARPLGSEWVPAQESLGRALARGVVAGATLPPWDNSAMDGYAVRSRDLEGGSRAAPVTLRVVGAIRAGDPPPDRLAPGEAVRIMTGAPLPDGADAVVRVEDTDAEPIPGRVRVFVEPEPGRDVRAGGQDMKGGEEVLPTGSTLGAGALGLLAATGAAKVRVHRRPRVAILSNGDELVAAGEFRAVRRGRALPETNAPTLVAGVTLAGGVPLPLGIARDNRESILERAAEARETGADVLLTSGGASMGEHDLLKRVLEEVGYRLDFWRVRMRPGTPFSLGFLPRRGSRPMAVFGLPGNPASSFVTFQVLCRPFLLRLAGHARVHRPVVLARAGETIASPPHLTHFLRVGFRGDPAHPEVFLAGPQLSGLVRGQGVAQGLAVVPEGVARVGAGEPIRVVLLDDFGMGAADPGYLAP